GVAQRSAVVVRGAGPGGASIVVDDAAIAQDVAAPRSRRVVVDRAIGIGAHIAGHRVVVGEIAVGIVEIVGERPVVDDVTGIDDASCRQTAVDGERPAVVDGAGERNGAVVGNGRSIAKTGSAQSLSDRYGHR